MVNVEKMELDFYKDDGKLQPFLNVKNAREDKLLGKWYTVKKAYLEDAAQFDGKGKRLEETIEKWHLDFEEIPHKMTLNRTNFNTMKKDFGPETDNWVGQRVKFRVQKYSGYNDGLVIIDKQELEDMGENPPESSSDEPEVMNVENEVNDIVNEQVNGQKKDWFDRVKGNLPQSKEDLKDKEKVACEWINRIRSDLLNEGVKKVTPKMIRDNVAVLVSEENMKEDDLGDLNEDAGRDIFKVLRNVDPV